MPKIKTKIKNTIKKSTVDIIPPGASQPQPLSKPIIVSNHPLISDPMVVNGPTTNNGTKVNTKTTIESKNQKKLEAPSKSRLVIEPLDDSDQKLKKSSSINDGMKDSKDSMVSSQILPGNSLKAPISESLINDITNKKIVDNDDNNLKYRSELNKRQEANNTEDIEPNKMSTDSKNSSNLTTNINEDSNKENYVSKKLTENETSRGLSANEEIAIKFKHDEEIQELLKEKKYYLDIDDDKYVKIKKLLKIIAILLIVIIGIIVAKLNKII